MTKIKFKSDITEKIWALNAHEIISVELYEEKRDALLAAIDNFIENVNYIIEHDSYMMFGERVNPSSAQNTATLVLTLVITVMQQNYSKSS